jgi:hypothetical protein
MVPGVMGGFGAKMQNPGGTRVLPGFFFAREGCGSEIPSAGAEWGRISLVNWGVAGTIRAHARPPA